MDIAQSWGEWSTTGFPHSYGFVLYTDGFKAETESGAVTSFSVVTV